MNADTAPHTTPLRQTGLLLLAFVGVSIVSIFTVLLPELRGEDIATETPAQSIDPTAEKTSAENN